MSQGLIENYPKIGVPVSKLVLGLPFYGEDNYCRAGTLPDARVCVRGKSGKELGPAGEFFQELPLMYDKRHSDACSSIQSKHSKACGPESLDPRVHTVLGLLMNRTSSLFWDDDDQSPFFNYVDQKTSVVHQVRFRPTNNHTPLHVPPFPNFAAVLPLRISSHGSYIQRICSSPHLQAVCTSINERCCVVASLRCCRSGTIMQIVFI